MEVKKLKQHLIKPLYLLQRWRQSAAEQLVGLDLGPGFVKLLKIDPGEDPGWVEAFGMVSLSAGVIAKDEIKDPVAVGAALREVFAQTGVKSKNVALAIPRSSTIIKTITVNRKLGSKDIESRAWVEANHHFPDLVGDIYLDFDIIGPSAQDPSQLDLLLVACRKDQIKSYLDVLQANDLNAKVVDVNCYAFERTLSLIMKRLPELKTIALLNLDYNISSLIVVHENQMIYAHDHSYEGLYFSTQVQQYIKKMTLQFAENPLAEEVPKGRNRTLIPGSSFVSSEDSFLRQNINLDALQKHQKDGFKNLAASPPDYTDILKAGISAHLRHTMHFFYSSRPHITIQQLILSGDCSSLPHLNAFIQKETGIKTVLADPFEGMGCASSVNQDQLQQYSSSLVLCCGLALSRLKEMEV